MQLGEPAKFDVFFTAVLGKTRRLTPSPINMKDAINSNTNLLNLFSPNCCAFELKSSRPGQIKLAAIYTYATIFAHCKDDAN
jgi:hypothetical protein